MLKQVVIYKKGDWLCALTPEKDELKAAGGDIHKVARKDVPEGVAYKVIDASDLPADRTFRSAWEVDDALLNDGVGANTNIFHQLDGLGKVIT